MKTTVNFCDFCDAFRNMDRDNNFSYDGKKALFDYFEEYEEDCGQEIELDVIAICCDFTEYADVQEFIADYGDKYQTIDKPELDDFETKEEYEEALEEYEEELRENVLEQLQNYTQVIDVDGTAFIIQSF